MSATHTAPQHRHYTLSAMLKLAAGHTDRIADRAIAHCRTCQSVMLDALRIQAEKDMAPELKEGTEL